MHTPLMTRKIVLTDDEQKTLERIRDTHPAPHMRERAAAILKVASGMSAHAVAKYGLLTERKADTVYGWLDRWVAEGLPGLAVKEGRGRKPKHQFTDREKEALQEMLHQSPELFGIEKSRWTIKDIQKAYKVLQMYSESGVWRLLNRLRIVYKRGKKLSTQPRSRVSD